VTLVEIVTGTHAEKIGEISLYKQHADFEYGSASNSNSTSPWVIACEPAPEPSCETVPLHEHFPYGLCNASRAHAEALAARRAGKEIASDFSLDSNLPPATTWSLHTSSTLVRIQSTLSLRITRPRNRCQTQPPAWSLHLFLPEDSSTSPIASLQT
jgi:hypothetical protein